MINTKLSVAIHILAMIATNSDTPITSDFIAGSVNTNPVVIRRISGQLKKAGLISAHVGKASFTLEKEPEEITILMVYQAVQTHDDLFSIHDNPNPHCWIGKNIQSTLDKTFQRAQRALEQELNNQTLADLIKNLSTNR